MTWTAANAPPLCSLLLNKDCLIKTVRGLGSWAAVLKQPQILNFMKNIRYSPFLLWAAWRFYNKHFAIIDKITFYTTNDSTDMTTPLTLGNIFIQHIIDV